MPGVLRQPPGKPRGVSGNLRNLSHVRAQQPGGLPGPASVTASPVEASVCGAHGSTSEPARSVAPAVGPAAALGAPGPGAPRSGWPPRGPLPGHDSVPGREGTGLGARKRRGAPQPPRSGPDDRRHAVCPEAASPAAELGLRRHGGRRSAVTGTGERQWEPLRRALREDDFALHRRLVRLREAAGVPAEVSAVCVLDVICWLEGEDRGC